MWCLPGHLWASLPETHFLEGRKTSWLLLYILFFIIFVFVEGIVCKVVSELGENNVGLAHAPYEELKQLCVYI